MSGYVYRNAGRNLLILLSCTCFASVCFGQRRAEDDLKIPDPETVTVETSDRVPIRCSYYPGGFVEIPGDKGKSKIEKKPGKEVVPVILLHGWEGRRRDMDELASSLQKRGHAVIAPDLRGHGDSTTVQLANGEIDEIVLDRLRSTDLERMLLDVEAAKKFLLDKNNTGEVNIELLCVIGADLGAIVAVNWAAGDWSRRQLPAFKQGRDVKALVLVSPQVSHKGFSLTKALNHDAVQKLLSILLIVGAEERDAFRDANSINTRLERGRPEQPTELADKTFIYLKPNTPLQGTKLINAPGLGATLRNGIATFIEWRLVRKVSDFPWTERKSPLGGG